jgi:tRNA dimethylallyltransferase
MEGLSQIPEVPKLDMNLNSVERRSVINNYSRKYPGIFKGINLNDRQRVYRAISVYENTGTSLWKWYKNKNKKKYFESRNFVKIYLNPVKSELENRIKKRFDKMLKDGAIQETENLKKIKIGSLSSANFIIGFKEISQFLNQEIGIKELKEKVLIRSRQYAKRQFTWQRGQMKDWKGFEDTNYLDLRKKVLSYLSKT